MRRFLVLLKKELLELATPQMLIPFVMPVLIFALIGNLVGSQSTADSTSRVLKVLDQDASAASAVIIDTARETGFTVEMIDATDEKAALAQMRDDGGQVLVVIPDGFGETLGASKSASISSYTEVKGTSALGSRDAMMLTETLAIASDKLRDAALVAAAPQTDPAFLKSPVVIKPNVIVGDASAPVSIDVIMGFLATQTTFVPIVMFIVIIFAGQMVATAVATEKENKTLESLLAMPVSRTGLVAAKMLASGLLALVAAAWYMVGMNFYMKGMIEGLGGPEATQGITSAGKIAEKLGLTLGAGDYVLLGLSVFAAILVALAVALIIGAFAENVKAVQALITPFIIIVMVPYMLSLFLDFSTLPQATRLIVMAIPFTHPFLAAPDLLLGDTVPVLWGIAYQTVWFIVLVVLAARIFSSDRILTMKLKIGRKKETGVEP